MVQKNKYLVIKDLLKFLFIRGFVLCGKSSTQVIECSDEFNELQVIKCYNDPLNSNNKREFDKVIIKLSKLIDEEFYLEDDIKYRQYTIFIDDIKIKIAIKHCENAMKLYESEHLIQLQTMQLLSFNWMNI
jgi:hypothetical protein